MKRMFMKAAAVLGAMFFAVSPMTVCAAETGNSDGLVVEISSLDMEIAVPDFYEFVFDRTQSYRGDLGDYGIDVNSAIANLNSGNTYFEALYISGDYFCESYMTYNPADTDVTNLCVLSDEELDQFGSQSAMYITLSGASNDLRASYDQTYKINNAIVYVGLKMTFTDETNGDASAYCLGTIVDGKSYYFYTRTYSPDADMDELKDSTQKLVDSVKYYNENRAQQALAEKEKNEQEMASSESSQETMTQEEFLEKKLEEIQNNPDSKKTLGEYEKEQEELQKKTRMYYLLGKWSVRIGIPLIIILVAYIPRKIKEKRSDRQWYKEHGYNDDDDYNGSY